MPRVTSVTYAITRQFRRYEPVRVEVTVERGENEESLTDEELLLYARNQAETMIVDAANRVTSTPEVNAHNIVRNMLTTEEG